MDFDITIIVNFRFSFFYILKNLLKSHFNIVEFLFRLMRQFGIVNNRQLHYQYLRPIGQDRLPPQFADLKDTPKVKIILDDNSP